MAENREIKELNADELKNVTGGTGDYGIPKELECPYCGGTNAFLIAETEDFKQYKCGNCGLVLIQ